ncbi:MAG: RluA family pseudouridine synthase [Bacteroidales bacterium]|nr:RluA family pseudouridine synthase [Bacteroidales bacterium]MBD5205688.1 RluA family pseudouridine synthase [Bacteroidales bacterium]MBD5224045.1 RluA family pseudouridine synthase [Bacteroidales bacterium]
MDSRKNKNIFKVDRILNFRNETETEKRLMDFIIEAMPDAKRNDVKKWLRYGHLMVNGVVGRTFDVPVLPGAEVALNLSRPFPVFSHPRIDLIYEDDDVMVINKGYGMLSVGTASKKKEENAYDIMRAYVKNVDPRNKLWVVHRLDRHTTGLMMFAKSEKAHEVLRHNWNNIILERLYVALLEGYLEQDKGFVKSRLTENSQYVVYSTDVPGEGRIAVTHYEVMGRGNGYTLAHFSLDTGRKNQIRVHAADMGHPIAGDRKYGAQTSPIHRLALHAQTLRFAHPITKKDMNFQSPVPREFSGVIRGRKKY